jgi:hypothetical protein
MAKFDFRKAPKVNSATKMVSRRFFYKKISITFLHDGENKLVLKVEGVSREKDRLWHN